MMSEHIHMIVCPETHQKLSAAPDDMVLALNRLIAAKELRSRSGQVVRDLFDAGLVREDKKLFYPIRDGIPVMLVEEAIVLETLDI